MQIGATTMESSMEVPQQIKNGATISSNNSASRYLSEENKVTILKRHLNSSTFEKILHSELVLDESESNKSIWKAVKKLLTVDKDEQEKQINEKNN